ncbi:YqaA family protein [Kordiimonas marina]|uniref:YqaA family protein n=1 Tax=Kordiimonas marina TaxID=2872312 RepID=UPI001FF17ED0|nr:YqaA family protein [Kordiimonas marina]MCJ9427522.1 DedA family protein [Kordiimonas marina]
MTEALVLAGLFLNAFVAATLLPAWSEVTLTGLLATGQSSPLALFLAATTGNILGSILNWWLGKNLLRFQDKRWFPFKPEQLERAQGLFARYGMGSLLLAWAPIIGDPLTFVAGILKAPLLPFVILVGIGKAARYGLIVLGVTWAMTGG